MNIQIDVLPHQGNLHFFKSAFVQKMCFDTKNACRCAQKSSEIIVSSAEDPKSRGARIAKMVYHHSEASYGVWVGLKFKVLTRSNWGFFLTSGILSYRLQASIR